MKNPNERLALLDRAFPALLGVVATLEADGHPHAIPVWYRYEGSPDLGRVYIWTQATRHWVRNIARDPRVSFSVQEDRPPFAAVTMRGRVTIHTSDADEVSEEIRRITRRYIEGPRVEAYIQNWLHLRTIVTLTPETMAAWGVGY